MGGAPEKDRAREAGIAQDGDRVGRAAVHAKERQPRRIGGVVVIARRQHQRVSGIEIAEAVEVVGGVAGDIGRLHAPRGADQTERQQAEPKAARRLALAHGRVLLRWSYHAGD